MTYTEAIYSTPSLIPVITWEIPVLTVIVNTLSLFSSSATEIISTRIERELIKYMGAYIKDEYGNIIEPDTGIYIPEDLENLD